MTRSFQTANALLANERLDEFKSILLAAGWTQSDGGWVAPEHFREDLAREVGRGTVHLWTAIAAQVQFDEAVIRYDAQPLEAAA